MKILHPGWKYTHLTTVSKLLFPAIIKPVNNSQDTGHLLFHGTYLAWGITSLPSQGQEFLSPHVGARSSDNCHNDQRA